jgi:TPR repeat protein
MISLASAACKSLNIAHSEQASQTKQPSSNSDLFQFERIKPDVLSLAIMKALGPALFFCLLALTTASAAELTSRGRVLTHYVGRNPVIAAAEFGDKRAQARLGFMYATGRGVPQNHTLAAYWYRRGAEQGEAAAQHLLGLAYDKGQGVPMDRVLAYMWLNLAAAATLHDVHEYIARLRDAIAGKISFQERAIGQALAVAWAPKPER